MAHWEFAASEMSWPLKTSVFTLYQIREKEQNREKEETGPSKATCYVREMVAYA